MSIASGSPASTMDDHTTPHGASVDSVRRVGLSTEHTVTSIRVNLTELSLGTATSVTIGVCAAGD
jgi:hypothetical protein